MKIKHLLTIVAATCLLSNSALAQQSKSDESVEFKPNWNLQLQGGASYTLGEGAIGDLISPAAYLSAKYNFHNALGVRVGVGGWQGKGIMCSPEQDYAFKFAQLNADFVVDICNLLAGYDHKRVVNPYVFAGVGAMYAFDNDEAVAISNAGPELEYLWDDSKFFVPGRVGVGVNFRCSEKISIGLEGNASMLSDHFNSKKAENSDWHFNLLAGVTLQLGKNTRPSEAYAAMLAEKAAAEQEAKLATERAEAAERAKAKRIAAEKAEAERLAAKRAAEKAEAEKIAQRKVAIEKNSDNVFFLIGSSKIRKEEAAKLDKMAQWLKQNPDFTVDVVGYADKETGTAKGNKVLSQQRAENVKGYLVKAGIDVSRIRIDYKGDTVQPFGAENVKNRVVICTLE